MSELFGDSKYFYYFLIASVFVGVFVRFWGMEAAHLEADESVWMISAIKLHHGNNYDPRLYSYEHPPIARWFIGLPTRYIFADFTPTIAIPMEMFVYNYFVPFKEVYVPMRMVSAIFGVFSVALAYLISRNLYGPKAGVWSAALVSLSFDFIFYSRWTLSESVFLGVTLFVLYTYITYLQEKNPSRRLLLMCLTAILFTLALGTRTFTPMFLIPTLILSQFLINRKLMKENMLFTLLVFIGTYVNFYLFWPPTIRDLGQKLFGVYSISDVLAFSLPNTIIVNLTRNSYLYVVALALLMYGCVSFLKSNLAAKRLNAKLLKEHLENPRLSLVFVILATISFIGFSFTKYTNLRYQIILFIPLMILSGNVLEKANRKKSVSMFLAAVVAVNFYFFASVYPYYSEYQNFSLKKCGAYTYSCTSGHEWANHGPELAEVTAYLKSLGNPPVITNEYNILAFYEGKSMPLLAPYDPKCNPDEIKKELAGYRYVVYWGSRSSQKDLRGDPYYCPYVEYVATEVVASFGNYSLPGKDPESLKLNIYRISQ